MKSIIKDAIEAEKRHNDHMSEITSLQEKGSEIDATLPDLRKRAEDAEAAKKKALDDFCYGKINQEGVDHAQRQYEDAIGKVKRVEELLGAVNEKIRLAERETLGLQQNWQRRKGLLFNEILKDLTNNLKPFIKKIYFAYAANCAAHRPLHYDNFLKTVFPEPQRPELNAFNSELDALYRKAIEK